MPSYTEKPLKLELPFGSEFYSVDVGNKNFKRINDEFKQLYGDTALDIPWLTKEKTGLLDQRIDTAIKTLIGDDVGDIDSISDVLNWISESLNDPESGINSKLNGKLDKDIYDKFIVDHTATHTSIDTSLKNLNKILFGSETQPEGSLDVETGVIADLKQADIDIKNSIGDLTKLPENVSTNSIVEAISSIITNYIGKPSDITNISPKVSNVAAGVNKIAEDVKAVKTLCDNNTNIIEGVNTTIAKYLYTKCIISYYSDTPVVVPASSIGTSSCSIQIEPMNIWVSGKAVSSPRFNTSVSGITNGFIGMQFNGSTFTVTTYTSLNSAPDTFIPLVQKNNTSIILIWKNYYIGNVTGPITETIDDLAKYSDKKQIATTFTPDGGTNGVDYAVTLIPSPEELYNGMTITIIPHTMTTNISPTLNVNGLGAKTIVRRRSDYTDETCSINVEGRNFYSSSPVKLMYDSNKDVWILLNHTRPVWSDILGTQLLYGTCDTSASVSKKVVNLTDYIDSISIVSGLTIRVKFTNDNTASAPTLYIGNKEIAIRQYNTFAALSYSWRAGSIVEFVYDGNYWIMMDREYANGSYYGNVRLSDSITTAYNAGNGYAATPYAVKLVNDIKQNEWIATTFTPDGGTNGVDYAVTLNHPPNELYKGMIITIIPHVYSKDASPTLNVEDFGPKHIYRNTSYSYSTNGRRPTLNWLAVGIPLRLMYDGTYWIDISHSKPDWDDISNKASATASIKGIVKLTDSIANAETASSGSTALTPKGAIDNFISKDMIVCSPTEPTNPVEGTIWLRTEE